MDRRTRTEASDFEAKCVDSHARLSKRNRNEYLADAPLAFPKALLALAAGRWAQLKRNEQ